MQEHHVRLVSWLAANLLFVPLLILLLYGYNTIVPILESMAGNPMPTWLNSLCQFVLFGASYVGIGYVVASRLDRRYPDTPKRSIRTPY